MKKYIKIIVIFSILLTSIIGYSKYKYNYNKNKVVKIPYHEKFFKKKENLKFLGNVIKVYDGDTITVVNNRNEKVKIRLYGIDAPELKQTYGKTSQMNLEKLIKNKTIEYEIMSKDRYGRIVAIIYFDGKSINEWLVANGFAYVYDSYNDMLDIYKPLEEKAKNEKLGLWAIKNMIKPSDYRKQNK